MIIQSKHVDGGTVPSIDIIEDMEYLGVRKSLDFHMIPLTGLWFFVALVRT